MDSEGSSSCSTTPTSGSKRRRRGVRSAADRLHLPAALEKPNHVVEEESEEEDDGDDDSCTSSPPPRPAKQGHKKVRRRRKSSSSSSSDSMEEDIIDGFSIRGFKTLEDLENVVRKHQKKLPPEKPLLPTIPNATIVKPSSATDGGAVLGAQAADAALPEASPITPLVVAVSVGGLSDMTNATTPTMPPTAVTAIAMETATTPATPNPSRPTSPLPALPTSTPTGGEKVREHNSSKKDSKKSKNRLLDTTNGGSKGLNQEKLEQRLNQVLDNKLESCLTPHSKADLAPLLDGKVQQHKVEHIKVGRVVNNSTGPHLPLTLHQQQQQQFNKDGRVPGRGVVLVVGGENKRMTPPLSVGSTTTTSTTPTTVGGVAPHQLDQKAIRQDGSDRTDTKLENRTLDHRIPEHRTENPKDQQQQQLLLHHQHLHHQQQQQQHQSPQQPLEPHPHSIERHLENNKLPDHMSIIKIPSGLVRPQPHQQHPGQQHLLPHQQTHSHHQHHQQQHRHQQHPSSDDVVDKKPNLSQLQQQNGPSHCDRPLYHDRLTECNNECGDPLKVCKNNQISTIKRRASDIGSETTQTIFNTNHIKRENLGPLTNSGHLNKNSSGVSLQSTVCNTSLSTRSSSPSSALAPALPNGAFTQSAATSAVIGAGQKSMIASTTTTTPSSQHHHQHHHQQQQHHHANATRPHTPHHQHHPPHHHLPPHHGVHHSGPHPQQHHHLLHHPRPRSPGASPALVRRSPVPGAPLQPRPRTPGSHVQDVTTPTTTSQVTSHTVTSHVKSSSQHPTSTSSSSGRSVSPAVAVTGRSSSAGSHSSSGSTPSLIPREPAKPIPGLSGRRPSDSSSSSADPNHSQQPLPFPKPAWPSTSSATPSPHHPGRAHASPVSSSGLPISSLHNSHTPTTPGISPQLPHPPLGGHPAPSHPPPPGPPGLHPHPGPLPGPHGPPPPGLPGHPSTHPPPVSHPAAMFHAPQLPHPPTVLTSTALPSPAPNPTAAAAAMHPQFASEALSFQSSQDFLRQELNTRFLASQDRQMAAAIGPPPYLRAEMHQHQHQHMHQHMHQHQHYASYSPLSGAFNQSSSPHIKGGFIGQPNLAAELAERDRQSKPQVPGLPNFPGISPMALHPPGLSGNGPISSGLHGAFQPKTLPSGNMHHTQLLMSLRDREKVGGSAPPPIKKSGKWCAVHVRVAWEIYHHQQKQQAEQANKPPEGKIPDSLRPPAHLMPGQQIRPGELPPGAAHPRSPFDAGPAGHPHSFISPSHLGGPPPFPRSPYGGLGFSAAGFAALGPRGPLGPQSSSAELQRRAAGAGGLLPRDLPTMPGLQPPHEWNRLHRTPPSFPTPPAWPAKTEAEREKERELSASRDAAQREEELRERERRKEREEQERSKEREREQSSPSARGKLERHNSLDDRGRDSHSRSSDHSSGHRPRSRSPLRNGPESSSSERPRSVSALRDSPSSSSTTEIRIKEERKDIVVVDDISSREQQQQQQQQQQREKQLREREIREREQRERALREREQREREQQQRERELRDREQREREAQREREQREALIRNEMLKPMYGPASLLPPNSMLERERLLNPAAFAGLERPPQPGASLWHPFDRVLDRQRLEALERERLIHSRFPTPLASMIERERSHYEQELLMRERARQVQERELLDQRIAMDRVAMDRAALAERERLVSEMDRNKGIPPLRPVDPLLFGMPAASLYLPRNSSPMVNHNSRSKTNSPSSAVGVPPPLIPSGSVRHTTSSPSSAAASKPKAAGSPVVANNSTSTSSNSASASSDNTSSSKDSKNSEQQQPSSNGHDTDAQSR